VQKFQLKLARALIVFMELLHLLIAKNRDLLLELIKEGMRTRDKRPEGPNDYASTGPPSTHPIPSANLGRDISVGSHQSMNRISTKGDVSLPGTRTPSRDRLRNGNIHHRRLSAPVEAASSSTDGKSREDSSVKTTSTNEEYDPGTNMSGSNIKDRRDSAIGIQRELQTAFISIAKDIWPMVHGIMESDTPRWLKQCCQENYFSAYIYRQVKIPIGEELTFEDVDTFKNVGSMNATKYPTAEKLGSTTHFHRSDKSYISQPPDSPNGSTGSVSAVSRGSDAGRSVKSSRSLRSQKERSTLLQGVAERVP